MKTREYATGLRNLADFLDSRPEFNLPSKPKAFGYYFDKDEFVSAVKALGAGLKEVDGTDFVFNANNGVVKVSIRRDKICRKVQEAVWDCEPLFTPEEVEAL